MTTPTGRFSLIRGLNNPEDLILLEGTDWVLASNMGDRHWSRGGFHLIHRGHRTATPLVPDFSGAARAPFDPDSRQDPALFSAHGTSVRPLGEGRFHVLAVNHGGRHSVEAFELDARAEPPVMTWIGGVALPEPQSGNAVAHLPGEAFAVTVTIDGADPKALERAAAGLPCGFVLEWTPGQGWRLVPGSEVSGDNGLLASEDGAWLFVAAYAEGAIYKLSRDRIPYVRQRAPLNFLLDNVRFSPNGSILAAGHPATTFADIIALHGDETVTSPSPTAVAKVDPETLAAKLILIEQATADFGGGTSAIVVDDELWIGSYRGLCVATIPLAALGNPEL